MNELVFQEEWLSAYLDDELTEEQRRVVEQRLAIDSTAQATLEDLQRVRAMVAKLPSWSGPTPKFSMPTGTPGSYDEGGDEPEDESDDLDDFEEVPRLIATDEIRISTRDDHANAVSSSRSMRSWLGWIAMAASILLVAGLGYVFWPTADQEVAMVERQLAPSMSAKAVTKANDSVQTPGRMEENEENKVTETYGLSTSEMSSNRLRQAEAFGGSAKQAAENELLAEDERRADFNLKLERDLGAIPSDPSEPAGEMRGGAAGARTSADFALNNLPANAPTAELPPPSPLNARQLEADSADSAAHSNSLSSPTLFYARSQSWSDDETLSRLSLGTQQILADQFAYGTGTPQQDKEAKGNEEATESVLMAAIKPEVANSPEFFQNIVASNRLVEVDQRPLINQLSITDTAQTANSVSSATQEPTQSNSASRDGATANTANRFLIQRNQWTAPNQPKGNSFILFLNRSEANQIIGQLQEKGLVTSQVWTVDKQPESQMALGKDVNNAVTAHPQSAANQRGNEPLKQTSQAGQKAESTSEDNVILLLNGPPN